MNPGLLRTRGYMDDAWMFGMDALDALRSGFGELRKAGAVPMMTASACGLGAVYFGHLAATNHRRRKEADSPVEHPLREPIIGLVVSGAGFVGMLRMARLLEARGR